jgi:hypothetical protein
MAEDRFITLAGLLETRVRRKDLPLALLFGLAHFMASAWLMFQVRLLMNIPDSSGQLGVHPYTDPTRVLTGVISGTILMLFVLHYQVGERGFPGGLTLRRAVAPAIYYAALAFGATPIVRRNSGSFLYASVGVVITTATILGSSLLLRTLRKTW